MTDRISNSGAEFSFDDLTKSFDAPESTDTGLQDGDALAGDRPLVRLMKRPTLIPVPRPHNAAALASSIFASSNLPVVNVHAKTRKLELRGH